MKVATVIFMSAILISAISCKKDNNGIEVQNHDENAVMKIAHDMIDSMSTMVTTGDPDIDFATMMMMHHEGAINMSNYEISNGDDADIKNMATNIINAQEEEMMMLDSFLSVLTMDTFDQGFMDEMMEGMDIMDKSMDTQIIIGDADYDFASLIIPHHQSAIDLAYSEIEHGNNEELKQMAHEMIDAQTAEIMEFQAWLLNHKP
jgi:uncharacterized protein (DUF305 family)